MKSLQYISNLKSMKRELSSIMEKIGSILNFIFIKKNMQKFILNNLSS